MDEINYDRLFIFAEFPVHAKGLVSSVVVDTLDGAIAELKDTGIFLVPGTYADKTGWYDQHGRFFLHFHMKSDIDAFAEYIDASGINEDDFAERMRALN